jgi:hypothetical protein
LLTINDKLTVSIGMATCVSAGTIRTRRWQLRRFKYTKSDLVLVIKKDEFNAKVEAYYLLPTAHLALKKNHKLRMAARVFAEAYRHDSLSAFCRMRTRDGALLRRKSPRDA